MSAPDMTQAIVFRVLASPAVAAANAGAGCFPQGAKQGTAYPRLTYTVASRLQERTYSGVVDLNAWKMTFTAYAKTEAEASALGKAVVDTFDGFAGVMAGGGFRTQGSWVDDAGDDYEEPVQGGDPGIFVQRVDVSIYWNRA